MIHRDSIEFTTALALGAALGVSLALLVAPDRVPNLSSRPGRRSGTGAWVDGNRMGSPSTYGKLRLLLRQGRSQKPLGRGSRK